jgi:hypothetical protein
VKARRQGTFVYYSAADQHVQLLLAQALFHADHIDSDSAGFAGAVPASATSEQ